ncbi:dolichyl-diphosphooligosaccharide--protein glycosyltransferas-like protein subunit 1 [Lepidopterella palustris CBS 459.81]|uniref:Dolichyl-diphosphooligosaccharide--protein glycosyltransferase subunit 1 n=1 Tax=Lepidopterella palustris CBS 459.81 TaxID=1314670 RepID=A0A8E2E8Y6_9PEZI|nr:dolichyl-diphosphooligosaccharide--protein glycosyltransferas-like protein subunit 1 [Lepidopterella palustris CBS 459.81]
MRSISLFLSCITAISSFCAAELNLTESLSSKQILPSTFKPPQVFKNVNLVRTTNLDKAYPRETINVIIENIDSKPQSDYYLPFESGLISRVGGLEVKDKKAAAGSGPFNVEVVEYDSFSPIQFYLIHFPEPLAPKTQLTLGISYSILSANTPVPASIGQLDRQYVQYTFNAYVPSAYTTSKQKTKLKFPSTDVPDYTSLPAPNADGQVDPQKQGSTFTYGPYDDIPAGATESVSVRYEFTKPLTHVTLLERDIEVSHWGGNLATEERYWLTNRAATLANHFSRVTWQMTQYQSPPTSALKQLNVPLTIGSLNPYFTDDIGNVSTSKYRSNNREAMLELKPRYPIFGGWKYSFKIGWDADLKNYLRKLKTGDGYVLKVPFLEGPKMPEGVEYEKVEVRIILPEGATNIHYQTSVPHLSSSTSVHRTFMDTIGRTTLKLSAINLVDEWRGRDIIVTYDYPWTAGLRKPVVIFVALLSVFTATWVIGSLDVSIGKKKAKAV